MRTSNVERRTSNIEVKNVYLHGLRRSKFNVRRSTFALILCCFTTLSSCATAPEKIDTAQRINAGVNILPEAVLAAEKVPLSNHAMTGDQLDLIDAISDSDQQHYTLIKLLRAAGMVQMLQRSGPYTLLAPTDDAFAKLPPGVVDRLGKSHQQLAEFLKYHLLPGRITFNDMLQTDGQVRTLAGQTVIVKGTSGKVMINDANVLRTDSTAANGVVQWIDTVLIPE